MDAGMSEKRDPSSDAFCAFCFTALRGKFVVERGRRYCCANHAKADRTSGPDLERAVDEMSSAPPVDQLELGC
jgi:hypothetical protein